MDTINTDNSTDPKDEPTEEGALENGAEGSEASGGATGSGDARDAATAGGADDRIEGAHDDEEAGEDHLDAFAAHEANSAGVLAGAAAIVALGLALASLTGTWLGTLISTREQLIGQIKSQSGSASDQIAVAFGTPLHTTALFNGVFAVVGLLVAVAVLVGQQVTLRPPAGAWVKAVAWGALALGAIGLVIAGAMWFDVFTSLPTLPTPSGGAPTG